MRCALCARRNRTTESESHVCVNCGSWLQVQVAEVARLAADAAAFVQPGSSTGGGARPVPGSRPPLRVEALDPELTTVPQAGLPPECWPTVLEALESWQRLVLEMRGMSKYGPWSLEQAARHGRQRATSWDNKRTKDPGEAATSRGVTDHREG